MGLSRYRKKATRSFKKATKKAAKLAVKPITEPTRKVMQGVDKLSGAEAMREEAKRAERAERESLGAKRAALEKSERMAEQQATTKSQAAIKKSKRVAGRSRMQTAMLGMVDPKSQANKKLLGA